MTGTKTELGPTGAVLAKVVNHHRVRLGLTYAQLSRRMTRCGRDIPPLGLRRIESGTRRVDVDDLVALAIALEVSPITLLMPHDVPDDAPIGLSGVTNSVHAKRAWDWLNASYPLSGEVMAFYSDALPRWERDDLGGQIGVVRRST